MPNILTEKTGNVPNWVWVAVIVGGIALAWGVPKLMKGGTGSTTQDQTLGSTGATPQAIGLAVDPNTGLPYAVEGLVPAGANAGASNTTTDLTATNALLKTISDRLATTTPVTPTTPAKNALGVLWIVAGKWVTIGGTKGRPLLPQGTKIPSAGGAHYSYQGQMYTIVPGSGGRIYGAPGNLTYAQAQNADSKVLLMAPSSYYA
jgi:hypothetical protein